MTMAEIAVLTQCQHSLSVSLAALEVVVDFGVLLTTRVHSCVALLDIVNGQSVSSDTRHSY